MSNVNNWHFAKVLSDYKAKVLDPQTKRVDDAQKIMDDQSYPWESEQNKIAGEAKLQNYKQWLAYYLEFYKQGLTLINEHENLVNLLSKWYDVWYRDISNEGRQEAELMPSQADRLNEIFCEIYKELQPLKLEGLKPPSALNLK